MIEGKLVAIMTCDGDRGHCGSYFKELIEVTSATSLNVADAIRQAAAKQGWTYKGGRDLCNLREECK